MICRVYAWSQYHDTQGEESPDHVLSSRSSQRRFDSRPPFWRMDIFLSIYKT